MKDAPGRTEVEVAVLPDCDFCKQNGVTTPAGYDGRTTLGPWANMCGIHWTAFGVRLGAGFGQKLILRGSK